MGKRPKHQASRPAQHSRTAQVQRQWQRLMQEYDVFGQFNYATRARAANDALRLLGQIVAANRTYYRDPEADALIDHARSQYRLVLDAAYPTGFWEDYERLRAGDPAGLESAVSFLAGDPMFFRTGYIKTKLIRYIKPGMIGPSDAARLRDVVLAVVDTRDDRDFRAFCRLARKVDAPDLRAALTDRLDSADRAIRRRARWVLDALDVDTTKKEN